MSDQSHPGAGADGADETSDPSVWLDEEETFAPEAEDGPERVTRFVVPAPTVPADDAPQLEVAIESRYEWGSMPAETHPAMRVLVTLTPSGPTLASLTGGPAVHLILALDISASMDHRDKFPVLEEALVGLLDEMHAADTPDALLSVVVFARGAQTLFQAIPASSLTANELLRAVRDSSFLFGNYSDAVGALSRATRIALDSHRNNRALPVRIVLLTDGKLQDVETARHKVTRIGHMPVDFDAIAFGADSDVERLKTIVGGQRGGTVKHARTETLGDIFRRLGASGRRVGARLGILRFETSPGVVGGAAYRYRPARHAYGANAFQNGRVFETDVGTLECDRSYSYLFEVRLPETRDHETEIGVITLRVPGFGGAREVQCYVGIPRHSGDVSVSSDPRVSEACAIVEAIDHGGAEQVLRSLRARRKIYFEERRDPYLIEVVDRAIAEVEAGGSVNALSNQDQSALSAHTITVDVGPPPRSDQREYSFG